MKFRRRKGPLLVPLAAVCTSVVAQHVAILALPSFGLDSPFPPRAPRAAGGVTCGPRFVVRAERRVTELAEFFV